MSDMADLLGITQPEFEALQVRAEAEALTEADQALIATALCQLEDMIAAAWGPGGMFSAINEAFGAIFGATPTGPTYRTEPIKGAELGGRPRNPEDDVIDEIDDLVDWQLKNGGGW